MTTSEFGQFSIVSYVHQLRGERVNLGVLVWHPLLGHAFQFAKYLDRVRIVDEAANASRVKANLDEIKETISSWSEELESPLEYLSSAFQHGVVVSPPQNARMQSPQATLERTYSHVMAPEPFMRASSTTQFSKAFSSQMQQALGELNRKIIKADYVETEAFKPVNVALWFEGRERSYLWRAHSFAALESIERQVTAAKAIHAENNDLLSLPKYEEVRIGMAVQLPKPRFRSSWDEVHDWLSRTSPTIEVFEDRYSFDTKIPELASSDW